jgi:hypothetical protein
LCPARFVDGRHHRTHTTAGLAQGRLSADAGKPKVNVTMRNRLDTKRVSFPRNWSSSSRQHHEPRFGMRVPDHLQLDAMVCGCLGGYVSATLIVGIDPAPAKSPTASPVATPKAG